MDQSTSEAGSNESLPEPINDGAVVERYLTIPPDGGWGWIVVVASFVCNFVVDGSTYTFGIFLDDIGETYKVPSTKVAIANSILTGFYFLCGPIACAFINRVGFKISGIIGGLLGAIAYFCSPEMPSLALFISVFGVIGGLGFCIIYVVSVLIIGFYFQRLRSLATSIAVTGSSTGVIGFPVIVNNLLSALSWQSKFKIIAGFCLGTSLLSLFFKSLKPVRILIKDDDIYNLAINDSIGSCHLIPRQGLVEKLFKHHKHAESKPEEPQKAVIGTTPTVNSTTVLNIPYRPSESSVFISGFSTHASYVGASTLDKLTVIYEHADESMSRHLCHKIFCVGCLKNSCGMHHKNRPMYRDDIFYTASIYTLPMQGKHHHQIANLHYAMSITKSKTKERRTGALRHCPEAMLNVLETMLNFKLLKSPSFVMLALSGFLSCLGLYVPYIYLSQRAHEQGLGQDTRTMLFTALGLSNCLGRIVSGIVSTIPRVKPLVISYVTLVIAGVSTMASVLAYNDIGHFCYAIIFGITIAPLASLRAPIIVDLIGLENLTNAFGVLLVFQGFAALCGVPIAGIIVDQSGSYNTAFIYAGCVIFSSGILLIPIEWVSRWENKQKSKNVATSHVTNLV